MGNKNTKSSLRNAIVYLNISADPIGANDDKFWGQIFSEDPSVAIEVVRSIRTQEIRMLRDGSAKNFATLIYKMVERLCLATGTLCNTSSQQTAVLNATRVLIRVIPCVFEDESWRTFFEDNLISQAGELLQEPQLVYSIKSENEKNYTSYLPAGFTDLEVAYQEQNDDLGSSDFKSSNELSSEVKRETTPVCLTMNAYDELLSNELPIKTNLNAAQDRIALNDSPGDCSPKIDSTQRQRRKDQQTSSTSSATQQDHLASSLMKTLIQSTCDLLFCPEFTVPAHDYNYISNTVDAPPEDLKSLTTCDYVWEPGVGFDSTINSTILYDKNRSELLRLLLTCLSATLYETSENSIKHRNNCIEILASASNRHTLPLFTSILNIVLQYKPTKPMISINNLIFEDNREELVELSIQILIAVLDYREESDYSNDNDVQPLSSKVKKSISANQKIKKNLFIEYLTRIHRKEDLNFLVQGFSRLLGNRLEQGYLLSSRKQIEFDQELLILFWKLCSLNQNFVQNLLKSNEILAIVVPILYHLNENFQDPSKTALIHIGVFNLLILSGERNFGVKLNKPYTNNVLTNLPNFTGSHADLLIIIFHKLIMYGYDINQLYDYLLTIVANISPYLKGLTMLASRCLIQLFETFTSPYVIFTEPNYHSLVVFLLEIFNNIIQYQFDGNTNLVYTILTKRSLFFDLANLSTSQANIDKVLRKLIKRRQRTIELEKMISTEECKDLKSINENNNSNGNTNRASSINNNEANWRSLATVSSSIGLTNQLKSNNYKTTTRQEVSLVATPDLCHVTRPMHPFNTTVATAAVSNSAEETNLLANNNHCDDNNDDQHASNSKRSINLNIDDSPLSQPKDQYETGAALNRNGNDQPWVADGTHSDETLVHTNDSNPMSHDQIEQSTVLKTGGSMTSSSCGSGHLASHNDDKKWRPTSDWLKQWKQSLPLQTVMRTIEVLVPQIELLKNQKSSQGPDEAEVVKFLQNGTLVGLLPVPHPILIRKYRTTSGSTLWFRAYTWGVIYVRNSIWTDTRIRLIKTV